MSDQRITLDLRNPQQGWQEVTRAWHWLKPMLFAGHRMIGEFVCSKTREQENLYHSCFTDLARDCLYSGQKVDPEVWKRGLLQAFYEATKDDPDYRDDWKSQGAANGSNTGRNRLPDGAD